MIFHSHNAVISDRLRVRAESIVRKLGTRVSRAVDAVVRFEQDGPTRHVEIVLHASPRRRVVSNGYARRYGPALAEAVSKLETQLSRSKRTPKARARAIARP
ncbi:MAG: HPF/RaiA family ribosome-associated protein [Gemmatimonadota bacterium]|nr:HPF/RaiA family ribosome-associated protein [Gemmatimonadota bacterium]